MPDSRGRETRAEKRGHTPSATAASGRTVLARGGKLLATPEPAGEGQASPPPDQEPPSVRVPIPPQPDGAEWGGDRIHFGCGGAVHVTALNARSDAFCKRCRKEWLRKPGEPWKPFPTLPGVRR